MRSRSGEEGSVEAICYLMIKFCVRFRLDSWDQGFSQGFTRVMSLFHAAFGHFTCGTFEFVVPVQESYCKAVLLMYQLQRYIPNELPIYVHHQAA